jgi:hypothetical protein
MYYSRENNGLIIIHLEFHSFEVDKAAVISKGSVTFPKYLINYLYSGVTSFAKKKVEMI